MVWKPWYERIDEECNSNDERAAFLRGVFGAPTPAKVDKVSVLAALMVGLGVAGLGKSKRK